uniref:Uncharacterized protein n=1 Tax=Ditylenchus dipsaci TaxID=166011 RepID=A0A915CTF1_9BILA
MPDADLGAKRRKIGRQSDMNTSKGSVVPARPESESPEEAENTGILPKKLKEIFEMNRHRVETDYKLPFVDLLKKFGDEDQTRLDEAKCENSSIIPDKSLINCAVLVVEELLRCFDDLTRRSMKNFESAKETTDESADGKVIEPPEFSSILGLPYLLRLLENFSGVLLEKKDWTLTDTNSSICIHHFVNYLMDRSDEFYQSFWDYQAPSLQYFELIFKK